MTLKLRAINLQGVTPGGIAVLTLNTGKPRGGKAAPTLDKLVFQCLGGMLPSHITSIKGTINGAIFYEEKNALMTQTRDKYRGLATSKYHFQLDFTQPNARNGAVEQMLTSIPLSEVQDLRFEFGISGSAPATGRIEAEQHVRQPTTNPWILKRRRVVAPFANSGEQVIQVPVGEAGGKILRMYLHEYAPTASNPNNPRNITSVEVRVGGTTIFEASRPRIEYSQRLNGLVPQAGILCLDFGEDGNLSGSMDTTLFTSVEVRLQGKLPATYTVYYEYIDPINKGA